MTKKRRGKVKGRQYQTYDKLFREYLNKYSDEKGNIEIEYYREVKGKPNTYLLKKSERKTIQQIYNKDNKARSQIRKNLFISKKGNIFYLGTDNVVKAYRKSLDSKTNKYLYNICLTDSSNEKEGTNVRDYQMTCLVFGYFTPKAEQILNEKGLSAMFSVGKKEENTPIQIHHIEGDQSADPKDLIGMTTAFHQQDIDYLKIDTDDIDEWIKAEKILEDEFLGKPNIYIKKSKNDKIFKSYIGETEQNAQNKLFFMEYTKYLNHYISTNEFINRIAMTEEGKNTKERTKKALKRILNNYDPNTNYLSLWFNAVVKDSKYYKK